MAIVFLLAQLAFQSWVRTFLHPQVLSDESLGSFPFLTHYPELTLDYWAKKFGPLYSLWLGNQLFVIVSDPNIVKVGLHVVHIDPALMMAL